NPAVERTRFARRSPRRSAKGIVICPITDRSSSPGQLVNSGRWGERGAACSSSAGSRFAPWCAAKATGRQRCGPSGVRRWWGDARGVVVGALAEAVDVSRVVSGWRRLYFGLSVSSGYLEATVTMAVAAREVGVEAVVNMSQMTVSEMSIQNTTSSGQQRQPWLGEQALAWSGLPVVTIRPTMFLDSFFQLAAQTVRHPRPIPL